MQVWIQFLIGTEASQLNLKIYLMSIFKQYLGDFCADEHVIWALQIQKLASHLPCSLTCPKWINAS